MEKIDLNWVYEQLKNRYSLMLTNAFSLNTGVNAGFRKDGQVLFGQTEKNMFYLYNDDGVAVFEIENRERTLTDHWHPDHTREALEMVISFMEDTCEFDWCEI